MKVLVAAGGWFPDYVGGTERVVRATAEALSKRGHQVITIVARADNEPRVSSVNGIQLRRVLRRSRLPLTITDVYEMRRAIRATSSDDFDLVLAHGAGCAVAALLARSRKPVAFVFHASGFREARQRRSLGLPALERWSSYAVEPFLYVLERLALRYADRILVLSEFSRRLVLEIDPSIESRIQVVGGGVDIDEFAPAHDREALRQAVGITSDKTLLLTARRLVGRMGIEMLLEAFGQLHKRQSDIQLVVIGDGELRLQLETQRDRLGLDGAVKFLGSTSDAELRNWYRVADLFVLPTIAYEGFGMVTAEALACGTPVVATPVGATSEILTPLDGGLMAESVNARSLASAIERALARTDMAFRAACHAYARDHFAWDIIIGSWESALEELQAATAGGVAE
jgi:glycosyltransferase involved in cell wall biosynthesis